MLSRRLLGIVVLSGLLGSVVPSVQAQEQKAPKFLRVLIVKVKPGKDRGYRQFVTKLVEAHKSGIPVVIGRPGPVLSRSA